MNYSYKNEILALMNSLNRLERPSVASVIELREFYQTNRNGGPLSTQELDAVLKLFEKASDFREAFVRLEAILVQK